jgi:hypothetical protein
VSHRRNRRYCRACARIRKRDYDRQYKRDYRAKPAGQAQRQRESRKRRDQLDWAAYMRFWRKAAAEVRAKAERARARRYYARHRATILAQRRAQRAARKAAQEACSH